MAATIEPTINNKTKKIDDKTKKEYDVLSDDIIKNLIGEEFIGNNDTILDILKKTIDDKQLEHSIKNDDMFAKHATIINGSLDDLKDNPLFKKYYKEDILDIELVKDEMLNKLSYRRDEYLACKEQMKEIKNYYQSL